MLWIASCVCYRVWGKGVSHTPNLQTTTIHNYGWAKAMDLQFAQFRAQTFSSPVNKIIADYRFIKAYAFVKDI